MPPKKKTVSPSKVKRKAKDWRGGTLNMVDLVWNLHDKPEGQSMADVTFLLSDGTELKAHKLILATASPYFEALFYGPLANNNEPVQKVEVKDVEADIFRIIIQSIYYSGRFHIDVQRQDDKFLAIMEAADMYLLPKLFDIMAKEVAECAEAGVWENLLPQLERVSQMPLFSKVYKDIKKWIIQYLPGEIGKRDPLWEKLCPRVQADVTEDLEKIAWEKDVEECQTYIHLLRDIAFTKAPLTELIDKINAKLRPLVQSYKNKEAFIKAMGKIIKLEGRQKKINQAEIHLKVKTLLESKSWEELCETAFGDVVNLLEQVVDNTTDPRSRLKWKPNVPSRYKAGPDWDPDSASHAWKLYSGLLEFAHKYSLPRLIDHCELWMMDSLFYPEINALNYVIRASGKKIFENMHKLGLFKVLSEFPQHVTSPHWLKLTESEIVFIKNNRHHSQMATEDRVWTAIQAWCIGNSNDASEVSDKMNRIRQNNVNMDCDN